MPDFPEAAGAGNLRDAMVDRVAGRFAVLGLEFLPEVERAMRKVPRHLFCEGAPLEQVYGDAAVVTDRDEHGTSISSVSAAWLQAAQLGQAGLKAGDRVEEIGSGGYNAALAREVVGVQGSVTSVDIDPAVTERAMRCLESAGCTGVEVICMDAENELPGRTFDAIVVTVGAWDISPSWRSQLAHGGSLVVPLRTLGLTRSWALHRDGDALVSRSHVYCGFVSMRGEGANHGTSVPLRDNPTVGLLCDEAQDIDADALVGVLDQPRAEVWTGVTVGPDELYGDQDLWLATRLPNFCPITAEPAALAAGIVDLKWPHGQPAFVTGRTVAYRPQIRAVDEAGTRYEFGAMAHGPDRDRAAQFLATQIVGWDKAGRPQPVLSVHPMETPDAALPDGFVLDKRHHRLVISWASPAAG